MHCLFYLFFQPPVIQSVIGLSWGSYVGSPADAEPILVAKHQHHTMVADLVPLHSNDAFGLGLHTSILLCFSKEKGMICDKNVVTKSKSTMFLTHILIFFFMQH